MNSDIIYPLAAPGANFSLYDKQPLKNNLKLSSDAKPLAAATDPEGSYPGETAHYRSQPKSTDAAPA
ncbi:hypothetical protein IT777_09740 [Klebsiella quasipneumoniae]|nr:hypothetical protein [Klebsiella quasipneumoniae]MBY0590471.1 hypothetical protein [Klebsiella sp. TFW1]MBY0601522.1 hypothetical protein [Klebsiella sp. TF21-TM]HCB1265771.1 hypothetical protein [Klebsiella quasipneumoniae subsp. quasipneumoniae]MBC9937836.1 hypothetical protein [Klebsiella quasipneumoniae]